MRYLQSGDAEHREKVQKHFHIASWVYSERKDDLALRGVMRESYERLGFYTALEIEEQLEASGVFFGAARDHGR